MKSILKSVISYLVLAAFLVMLTPKNWLHDCQSEHSISKITNHTNGKTIHQSTDHCAFCDLHIPVLGISVLKIDFEFSSFEELKPLFEKDYCTFQYKIESQGRGPPAV